MPNVCHLPEHSHFCILHVTLSLKPFLSCALIHFYHTGHPLYLRTLFPLIHKVLTYVEYIAVSGVFQNIDPPPPSPPSECVPPPPPPPKAGGHTRHAVRGVKVNILEDARHWIGL